MHVSNTARAYAEGGKPQALTVAAGMSPGVPLCRAWSDRLERDGLEIALKGGQFGAISFYGDVREGRPQAS